MTDDEIESPTHFGIRVTLALANTSVTDEELMELSDLRPALEILR